MQSAPVRPSLTPAPADALIAEARDRARRRRLITLALLIAAAAAAVGLALIWPFSGGRTATTSGRPPRPRPAASQAGQVTGYIDACRGIPIAGAAPYAAGTVTALPGVETWLKSGDGTYRRQLPAVSPAARQHVAAGQAFTLDLAPGRYVLVARYDDGGAITAVPVTVAAGQIRRLDVPDLCK